MVPSWREHDQKRQTCATNCDGERFVYYLLVNRPTHRIRMKISKYSIYFYISLYSIIYTFVSFLEFFPLPLYIVLFCLFPFLLFSFCSPFFLHFLGVGWIGRGGGNSATPAELLTDNCPFPLYIGVCVVICSFPDMMREIPFCSDHSSQTRCNKGDWCLEYRNHVLQMLPWLMPLLVSVSCTGSFFGDFS